MWAAGPAATGVSSVPMRTRTMSGWVSRRLEIGEPHRPQKYRLTPPAALKHLSDASPWVTTKSLAATTTFEANAEPLALRQRPQWQ